MTDAFYFGMLILFVQILSFWYLRKRQEEIHNEVTQND